MSEPVEPHTSATEVSKLRQCELKWWFDQNLSREEQASTFTGNQLHSINEDYLQHGIVPKPGPVQDMFLNALEHLPPPGAAHAIEQKHKVRLDGVLFVVKLDWLGEVGSLPRYGNSGVTNAAANYASRGRAILDHKTSKDPKAYGIFSEAKALNDEQQLIYRLAYSAEHARYAYYEKTRKVLLCELELQHRLTPFDAETYERKHRSAMRGRVSNKTYVSDITIALPVVYEAFQRVVLPYAKRVIQLKLHPVEQNQVAYNTGACEEYGGCQRKPICSRYQEALSKPPQDDGSDFWAVGDSSMALDLFGSLPAAPQQPAAPAPAPAAPAAPAAAEQAPAPSNVANLFGSLPAAPTANTTVAPVPQTVAATPINGPAASTETIVTTPVDATIQFGTPVIVPSAVIEREISAMPDRTSDIELARAVRTLLRVWREG